MSKGLLFPITVIVTVSLGGCTIFPKHEPLRVMDLSPQEHSYQASATKPYSLRVDTPYASEPFNSTRILVKPNVLEFRIYEGVRWRDTAPVIVRDVLVQAIRASNGFKYVVSDTSPAATDLSLITELTGFHTEHHSGNASAVIQLHSWILDGHSRSTLCANSFSINQPLAGTAIEQVVEGFSKAGAMLSDSVSEWAAGCNQPATPGKDQARPPSDTNP
ncbi:MAG TPA: ABC-type transport auxiliary lipoprotein family protein [Marinobacter sp.]|nr:ABC-type transport auxiliary lipoprotein family protein [Marinobacter sp.]